MDSPINILLRTSTVSHFAKCLNSINTQTVKPDRIIIATTYDDVFKYAMKTVGDGIELLMVKQQTPTQLLPDIKNSYFNELLDRVESGYIMLLDDKYVLSHNNVIQMITDHIKLLPSFVHVWKIQTKLGYTFPPDDVFGHNSFLMKMISIYNICFPAPCEARFNGTRYDDFFFIDKVYRKTGKINWTDEILIG